MRALMWFREDLRIEDNSALYHACEQAERGVAAIYVITPSFWQQHDMAPLRIAFLKEGLKKLAVKLERLHISLKIIELEYHHTLATRLLEYAQSIQADALFFNKQYEVNELKRDEQVRLFFEKNDRQVYEYDDQIIFAPNSLLTKSGEPYKVFTPYKKAWIQKANFSGVPAVFPQIKKQNVFVDQPTSLDILDNKNAPLALARWPAGEDAAKKSLTQFIEKKIFGYADVRDFPAKEGTSKLSPYLSTGMISPRMCFHAAITSNHGELNGGNKGAETWISELIWREFYKAILIHFPHVSKHCAFKKETDKIEWPFNKDYFNAWCQGKTGYPLIDAAMRQMNILGWMHNRLRMVVAMFLSKSLFLDWRLGEKYFISQLIDGDLAANNGGWQWSASTGVDAAPYFRIFNPILQSQRFDPEGEFIKKYCPELSHLNNKAIHEPWKYQDLFSKPLQYPKPIVNHQATKEKVIRAFKNL